MKRNIGLLGILISLLVLTYFVYELGEKKDKVEKLQQKQLFRPGELGAMLSLSNVVVGLEREGEKFYTQTSRVLVDQRKLDSVFEILSSIRAMRILPEKEINDKQMSLMFPEGEKYKLSFEFEKGKLTFIFGEKLKFDQSFYLKVIWNPKVGERNVRYTVAEDVSSAKGMYNKENYHLSDRKYKRLLTILYLDADFFYETRPFFNMAPEQLKRLSFISQKQRPFGIAFDEEKTTPPPLHEVILYNHKKIKELRVQWAKMEADRVSPTSLRGEDQDAMVKVVSSWSKKRQGDTEVELLLFHSPEDSEFWLEVSGRDQTYIFKKRPDFFFYALQDLWRKSPQLPNSAEIIVKTDMSVSQKQVVDFFSEEARVVDSLRAWPEGEGKKWLSLSSSSDETLKFDVYRVQNELHLRDMKRELIYRYFKLPDWARNPKKEK